MDALKTTLMTQCHNLREVFGGDTIEHTKMVHGMIDLMEEPCGLTMAEAADVAVRVNNLPSITGGYSMTYEESVLIVHDLIVADGKSAVDAMTDAELAWLINDRFGCFLEQALDEGQPRPGIGDKRGRVTAIYRQECSRCGCEFLARYVATKAEGRISADIEYVGVTCDCEAEFEPQCGVPSVSEWAHSLETAGLMTGVAD